MAGDTRERIMEAALRLFARNGYPGTSMSDIAAQLGITKPALYKHYAAKQKILDGIVERMDELDRERAEKYHMPQCDEENFGEIYANTPADRIRQYSIVQFRHWTEEEFSSCFRKMLTLEQYRSPEMAALYHRYLGAEPLAYMAEIFRNFADSDETARRLALEFYGPIYLLYSIYDSAEDKDRVMNMLQSHIDRFTADIEAGAI